MAIAIKVSGSFLGTAGAPLDRPKIGRHPTPSGGEVVSRGSSPRDWRRARRVATERPDPIEPED